MYRIVITETARGSLRDEPHIFNGIAQEFNTLGDLKDFLIERYGKMPGRRKKIYVEKNGETVEVGFIHSFWNQDVSHNSKPWYQTDWIEAQKIDQQPVIL